MKKYIIPLLGMFLLLIITPAYAFGETATYDSKEKIYTISSLFGSKLAELKLIDNKCLSPVECEAIIWFKPSSDTALDKISWKFYNLIGQENGLSYDFSVLQGVTKTYQDNDVCKTTTEISKNGTKTTTELCSFKEVSYLVNEYIPVDGNYIFKAETGSLLKITGHRPINRKVEWVPTIYSRDLNEWAWWNSTWQYMVPIYLNNSVNVELTDFPYRLSVDYQTGLNAGKIEANCDDIRFVDADNTTTLDYEIVPADCNGTSIETYVQIPTLKASSANPTIIYMYYGGGAMSSGEGTPWDSNYLGVYHFEDTDWFSSTGNINLSIGGGAPTIITTGVAGNSVWLDGNDWLVNASQAQALPSSNNIRTTEVWANATDDDSTWQDFVNWGARSGGAWSNTFAYTASTQYYGFMTLSGEGYTVAPAWNFGEVWDYLVTTVNASGAAQIFYNGTLANTTTPTISTTAGKPMCIGSNCYNVDRYAKTEMDELRLSDVTRDANWIAETHWNMRNNQFGFGMEEMGSSFVIVLNSPQASLITQNTTINFNCSVQLSGTNLVNISLFVWNASSFLTYTNTIDYTGENESFMWYNINISANQANKWNCFGADDNGNEDWNTNRTVTSDTIPPNVTLLFPLTTTPRISTLSGTGAVLANVNYTYSDSNPVSCSYSYNGGSRAWSGCVNLSGIEVGVYGINAANFNNFTIYVNDTAGNEGHTTVQYPMFNISAVSANGNIVEGTTQTFNMTIDYDFSHPKDNGWLTTPIIYLDYNNSQILASNIAQTCGLGACSQGKWAASLTIPMNGTETSTYDWNWNITWPAFNGSAIYKTTQSSYLSPIYSQNVTPLNLLICDGSYNLTVNVSCWEEENITAINCTLDYVHEYWAGNGLVSRIINGTSADAHEHYFCLSIDSIIYMDSLLQSWNEDSVKKSYYLRNASASIASPLEVQLYILNSTLSTLFTATVYDEDYNLAPDRYVSVERYYPRSNSYLVVEIGKTNYVGDALLHIFKENPFYQFKVYDYKTLTKSVAPFQPICSVIPCTFTFIEQPDITSLYYHINNTLYNLSYSNNTETFRFDWTELSGASKDIRLIVKKAGGISDSLICDYSASGSGGTSVCDITGNGTGTYTANAYITESGTEWLANTVQVSTSTSYLVYGTEGTFWAIILIITISVMGLFAGSLVIGALLPIVGLAALSWIHFIAVTPAVLVGLFVLVLVAISRFRS